ncbi:hypothetical protein P4B35_01680 [Pontiellaceae bacterium B12227]|nr:hypothetical protein [Pontiellaceae bacterium B12227]
MLLENLFGALAFTTASSKVMLFFDQRMWLFMGMELSFEYKSDVLLTVIKGDLELEAANRCVDQLLIAAIDFRAERLLLDCRNLQGSYSTRDRFMHTDYTCESILAAQNNNRIKTIRIAYVARPMIIDPHRFGETVARNRGIDIFVTENWSDAVEWLGRNTEQLPSTELSCKSEIST